MSRVKQSARQSSAGNCLRHFHAIAWYVLVRVCRYIDFFHECSRSPRDGYILSVIMELEKLFSFEKKHEFSIFIKKNNIFQRIRSTDLRLQPEVISPEMKCAWNRSFRF